jgi:hypothetical protein
MSYRCPSCFALAGMANLTIDAYKALFKAIEDIIDDVQPEQREILIRAIEESTMMLNYGAS